MENHVQLKENLELLLELSVILVKLKERVEEKGTERKETWLQDVVDKEYDVDDLEYQCEELIKMDPDHSNSNASLQLTNKVTKCQEQVKDLIQSGKMSSNSTELMMPGLTFEKLTRYSYDDLLTFTSNFGKKIGFGPFGEVYKGRLYSGVKVAVKVLKLGGVAVEDSFLTEVRILGNTYHRNFVRLYGFCLDYKRRALVYEYMDNGSLDRILYNKPLGIEWGNFYTIAIEMAKALAYLHDGCKEQIIHHNFKPTNVLLDSNLCPRLADFGWAHVMDGDQSHYTILALMNRTRDYTAPEVWSKFSHVTSKSDVYSFGMLLFEILGGRRNGEGLRWFPKYVWDRYENGKLDEVIVSCGIMEKDRKKAIILSMVAMWCAQYTPKARPSMGTIVAVRENEVLVDEPPNPTFPSQRRITKVQPDMKYSEVSSSTHSKVSSFSMDVPQKLDPFEEQQSQEGVNTSSSSTENLMQELSVEKQTRYSYDELKKISANFTDRIGGGEYGDVFKGHISNGLVVAIKVLKTNDIVAQTFLAEVSTMSNTKHPNLIKLIGFCSEEEHIALVYEYMNMGSLDMILYNKPLSIKWKKLYGIAIDIARALAYLHHDYKPQIIHFDVKPANVLLDSDNSAKLADFGLATLLNTGASHITMSKIKGTPGFLAPETFTPYTRVTTKCDVFSFGMLLLEILGTAKNNQTTKWFPKHVWEKFKRGKLNDIMVERSIKVNYRQKAMVLSTVALWCIQHTPETRPAMNTVVEVLEKQILVGKPPDPFNTSHSVTMLPELNPRENVKETSGV